MTEMTMSWSTVPKNEPGRLVQRAVQWRTWLGAKKEHAIADAAPALGLSPRKARSLFHGEPAKISTYEKFMRRWWADMNRQAFALRAAADEIERSAEQERIASLQLSFDLRVTPCAAPSLRNSGSGLQNSTSGALADAKSASRALGAFWDQKINR